MSVLCYSVCDSVTFVRGFVYGRELYLFGIAANITTNFFWFEKYDYDKFDTNVT